MSTSPTKRQTRSERAVAQAKQDAGAVGKMGADAARSGAYLYPIYGLLYFIKNPKLFEAVKDSVYKGVIWSVGITVAMFIFAYLPQVAVLAVVSGPLAFIAAIPIVLAESYAITTIVLKSFLMSGATDKLFDAVLCNKGYSDLVERGRQIKSSRGGGHELGKSLLKPISSKWSTEGLVRYVLTLPLNLVPGVGTAFFLFYNGRTSGPSAHNRYFQLKGFNKEAKNQFIHDRQAAYTAFGVIQLAMGLVPVAGTVFNFSSSIGAALWAADMEKKERASRNGGGNGQIDENEPAGGKDIQQTGLGRKDEL